jgi:hypothetical protein
MSELIPTPLPRQKETRCVILKPYGKYKNMKKKMAKITRKKRREEAF